MFIHMAAKAGIISNIVSSTQSLEICPPECLLLPKCLGLHGDHSSEQAVVTNIKESCV